MNERIKYGGVINCAVSFVKTCLGFCDFIVDVCIECYPPRYCTCVNFAENIQQRYSSVLVRNIHIAFLEQSYNN